MKILLALLLLFSASVMAESGFFYDPTRDGEGIFVTIDKNHRIAFALFTYWDEDTSTAPKPSPTPPPTELELLLTGNAPIWYTGVGVYFENAAIGELELSVATNYPEVSDDSLGDTYVVGTFLIVPHKLGFSLTVDCNNLMPPDTFICTETYTFTDKLIGE